jgi:hypothetical protein
MTTKKIHCSACGFGALLFRTGESIALTIDSAKQIQVCRQLRDQPQANARRVAPLDCRDFREAVERLANNHKPVTQTSINDPEIEDSRIMQAPVEEAVDTEVGRSRPARETEVAEPETRSRPRSALPKAARRPSKKSVRGRSASSEPAIIAAG